MDSNFMNFKEVCVYFGLSPSTVRRILIRLKQGVSTFPMPVTGWKRKALWRREEIENWQEAAVDHLSLQGSENQE